MTTKLQPSNIDTTLDYSVHKLTVSGVDVLEYAQSAFTQANTAVSNGQDAGSYANAAFAKANTGIKYTSSNTAPSGPTSGDQWYKIDQGILFEYINDGSTSTWIDILTPTIASTVISGGTSGILVTSVTPPDNATARDTTGGETVTITGSGFNTGIKVYINTTNCNTTFANSTSLTFTTPALSAGTYNIILYNTDGSSGTKPGGITFAVVPVWVTSAGELTSGINSTEYSTTVSATGTDISYSVTSESLPTGLSLNSSSGAITGTPTAAGTFNFTITATNTYNQTSARAFSIAIANVVSVSYLVVAGGGSGGTGYYGGGGGAGGYLESETNVSVGVEYTITVGTGGVGTTVQTNRGGMGGNSAISGAGFTTITAIGGGGGGSRNNDSNGLGSTGGNGGSGGGASFTASVGGKGVYPGSSYLDQARQGYDGGTTSGTAYSCGGGGAGAPGNTIDGSPPRAGGAGLASAITGTSVYYAGGGGNAFGTSYAGVGGGGLQNTAGTANSGGGGGGGSSNNGQGGNGGSGVVIIKYPDTHNAATTTGSPTVTSVTGYRIYTFTGTGTFAIN